VSGSASSPPAGNFEHVEGRLDGEGGVRLHWQAWLPPHPPRAVVVIAHGASEHGGRYRYVVERLVPAGYAVYAVDHRGHGRSEGPRAYLDRIVHVVADLDRLVVLAHAEHPALPVFLLGHSMGGCVAIAYALAHQERLHGLALSAPLAHLEAAPLPLRLVAKALSALAPRTGVYSVDASGVSRDPTEVEAYETDPLVFHGKLPARTVTGLAALVASFPDHLPDITLPVLVMHGTADPIVPVAAAHLIHDRIGSQDRTLRLYEGFYHELFNEPAGERDRPLDDLAAWLDERAPARPA
jgi:acylglycerol lipase